MDQPDPKLKKLGIARNVDRALWLDADHRKDIRAAMRLEVFA